MTILESSEIIRNVLLAVTAPFAARVAWLGLNTWKYEKQWERDNALARNLLIALQRRLDSIRRVRSPFVSAQEMEAAIRAEKDTSGDDTDVNSDQAWILAINARMADLEEAQLNYYGYQIEAAFVWDDSIDEFTTEIREMEFDAVFSLKRIANDRMFNETRAKSEDERAEEVNRRKLAFGTKGDEFDKKYVAATDAIRGILTKKLAR